MPRKRKQPQPISLRAYAQSRKERDLDGGSHEAVRRAIESGRLEASVVVVDGDPKIADADLADREWADRTRPAAAAVSAAHSMLGEAPAPPPQGSPDPTIDFFEARRRREVELWRQTRVKRETEELELAERRGELLPAGEVEGRLVQVFSRCKNKLLGVPSRARQQDPSLSADQLALLETLIREALEDLAGGAAPA